MVARRKKRSPRTPQRLRTCAPRLPRTCWSLDQNSHPQASAHLSALGQKQTSRRQIATSFIPPVTDMQRPLCHVRKVPKAEVTILFDHLIGKPNQGIRYIKTKSFSRLQIDDHFVFGRLLNWQVGRSFTSKD